MNIGERLLDSFRERLDALVQPAVMDADAEAAEDMGIDVAKYRSLKQAYEDTYRNAAPIESLDTTDLYLYRDHPHLTVAKRRMTKYIGSKVQ